jgi:superfamily I DNA/RNA helicase
MRFYDRKEVRDLLSYLAAIFNPSDEIALLRIINYPPRGIGHETIHKLQEASLQNRCALADVLAEASSVPGVGERQARAIAEFLAFLAHERERFVPGRLAAATEELVRVIGFEDAVRHAVKDPVAAERKAENIREVAAALAVFEKADPDATLGDYLAGVNLGGREEENDEFPGEAVTLLTVHSAKGLEFPHVFLTGMEEGLLPHRRSEDEPGGLEEERRLTYVGMTRARHTLTLSHAGVRTKWAKQERRTPSRFLDELPEVGIRREDRRKIGSGGGDDEQDEGQVAEEFFRRLNRIF